jgi:hypothetical protein
MSHIRTRVRKYIKNKLLAARTLAGDRVTDTKIGVSLAQAFPKLPAISVYTYTDKKIEMSSKAPEYLKEITVEVQAIVNAATDDFAELLDDLCLQIEAALDFDYYLGTPRVDNLVNSFMPDETKITGSDEGQSKYGIANMTYKATYYSTLPDVTANLNKFEIFNADIDCADPTTDGTPGPDGQIDANIHLTNLYEQ